MATAAVRGVFATFARTDARSDADLLRRFAVGRDEAAFAELVRRHGPLVLGVCRRVVPDAHLADDAFQAAFVVLANKAAGLDAARPLGPWLYGVAFRVALRARLMIGRRRRRETLAATLPDVPAHPTVPDDLAAMLDEEISKLSAACREAVVLCELQGVSRKDAAKRLGIAEGTLSSRLAAARKTLAARLRKRGVALAAGLTSTIFVPTDLLAATVAVSTGKLELSTRLMKLIEGATHMALLSKLKLAAVAVAFAVLSVGGVGVWRGGESNAAPVPKVTDDGLIWTHHTKTNTLTAYTPDGKPARAVKLPGATRFVGFTSDGTKMLFAGVKGKAQDEADDGFTLHVGDISEKAEGTDTGLGWQANDQFVISPDRKQIVRQRLDKVGGIGAQMKHEFSHVLFDVATKKETPIDLPTDHQIMQWTAGGKAWLVLHSNLGDDPKLPAYRWFTTAVGSKPKLTPICDEGSFDWLEPTADGKMLLGAGYRFPRGDPPRFVWMTVDPMNGKATTVKAFNGVTFACFRQSPDGKRVAWMKYGYEARDVKDALSNSTHLLVYDADGKNETKLFTAENDGQATRLIGWFPSKPDARRRNAPVPKAGPREGVILVSRPSHTEPDKLVEVLETTGKSRGHLDLGKLLNVHQSRVSPDGKKLAFVRFLPLSGADPNSRGKYAYPEDVYVVDLPLTGPPKEPVIKGVIDPTIAWAVDGKGLFVSSIPKDTDVDQDSLKGKLIPKKTVRYDVAAKSEKAVGLPEFHAVQDVSPDGKTLLTRTKMWHPDLVAYSTYMVPLDTLKPKSIGDEEDGFEAARLSPEGTRVLGTKVKYTKSKEAGLFVADVANGRVEAVPLKDVTADKLDSVAWAPDGKRAAVLWRGPANGAGAPRGGGGPGGGGGAEAHRVTVFDLTGENAKAIREFQPGDWQYQIEWADPKLADADKPAPPPDPRKKNAPVPK